MTMSDSLLLPLNILVVSSMYLFIYLLLFKFEIVISISTGLAIMFPASIILQYKMGDTLRQMLRFTLPVIVILDIIVFFVSYVTLVTVLLTSMQAFDKQFEPILEEESAFDLKHPAVNECVLSTIICFSYCMY